MAQYTVQSGDTLSAIAQRYGVGIGDISGYRSGDPNKIFTGENLSIGGGGANNAGGGSTTAAPLTGSAAVQQELSTFDASNQSPVDVYNQTLNKLGISDARTRITNLRQALVNNEALMGQVQGDVRSRGSDYQVTEGRRRELTSKLQQPYVETAKGYNSQLGLATADEASIVDQARTQTDLYNTGQQQKRQALLDRLKLAIDNEQNEEKKRQWQAEYDLAKSKASSSAKSTPKLVKNSAGGWEVTGGDGDMDLSQYARETGKDLVALLEQGDAEDRRAADNFHRNLKEYLDQGIDPEQAQNLAGRKLAKDRPTAFYLGG